MRPIQGTYQFTAPAEVVFGVLTDPHRTSRWLPRGMNAESAETDRARVRSGSDVHDFEVQISTEPMRMRWHAVDGSGLDGSVLVEDAPAGGSTVRAEIAVPGRDQEESRARRLLDESMEHLQRDVSDNFNAG
jgi:uncharacterized protein YndB with AHSA1/START domain